MALSSMTGFARADGAWGSYVWTWEVRSVNAKGLEVRFRLPTGWELLETMLRTQTAKSLSRGTVSAVLNVRREGVTPTVRVNEPVLGAVIATIEDLGRRVKATPATLDGILALKGVIDVLEDNDTESDRRAADAGILESYSQALASLATMRRHEGDALARILLNRIADLEALVSRADSTPGRAVDAVKARLKEQVAALLESSDRFDADRLHQEALLLAAKADIREELDRLHAHLSQARHLLEGGGAVGRKLDFLSQELNREANTLCAKSNDVELTRIGLEMKGAVEQFREQVQNLE